MSECNHCFSEQIPFLCKCKEAKDEHQGIPAGEYNITDGDCSARVVCMSPEEHNRLLKVAEAAENIFEKECLTATISTGCYCYGDDMERMGLCQAVKAWKEKAK